MGINLDSFRAIAGNENAMGFAVLNDKGNGLKKVSNNSFAARNVRALTESENNASVRYMFYSAVRQHLLSSGSLLERDVKQFQDEIGRTLGFVFKDGGITISQKPLEQRTIRAVLDAVDVFEKMESLEEDGNLTTKETAIKNLFSMDNFSNDDTNPNELLRLSSAISRLQEGQAIAETLSVRGTKFTLLRDDDVKGSIKARFGKNLVSLNVSPNFAEAAMTKALSNPAKLSKLAKCLLVDDFFSKALDDLPVLDPKAQQVAKFCRTLILNTFPKGIDETRFNLLSPKAMTILARHLLDGSYSKAQNLMASVESFIGQYNSITGEKRNPGPPNELGRPVDQNINTQENDYLVSKFLSMEQERQDLVKFKDEVQEQRPVGPVSDQQANEVFKEYAEKFAEQNSVVNKAGGAIVGGLKNVLSKITNGLGNKDDIKHCEQLFCKEPKKAPKKEETGFLSSFSSWFLSSAQSQKEVDPSELKTDFTADEVRTMLADETQRAFVLRLLCKTKGEDWVLEKLGAYEKSAAALLRTCHQMEEFKALEGLIGPDGEQKLGDALDDRFLLGGKIAKSLAELSEKFASLPEGGRSGYALLRLNLENVTLAAKLLTHQKQISNLPPECRAKVQELCTQLMAEFGELVLVPADEKKKTPALLLKNACDVGHEDLIAEKLQEKVDNEFSEQEMKDCRAAFADLLQDSDTWQMDQLASKPGARLSYSLEKNVDRFAKLLCNPSHIAALGTPTSMVADNLLGMLRDNVFTPELRAEFHPGNEEKARQLLTGVIRSTTVKAMLPMIEKRLDSMIAVKCKEMQAITSSIFAKMLSGDKDGADVDDVQKAFDWLSKLIQSSGLNGAITEAKAADEVLSIIAKLPEGKAITDFQELYQMLYPVEKGKKPPTNQQVVKQLTFVGKLMLSLAKHPDLTLTDILKAQMHLVSFRALEAKRTPSWVKPDNPEQAANPNPAEKKVEPPSFEDELEKFIEHIPAGISVDDYANAFRLLRENDPIGLAVNERRHVQIKEFAVVALAHNVTLTDVVNLSNTLMKQKQGPNEKALTYQECLSQLAGGVAPEGFVEDFKQIFEATNIGNGDARKTLSILTRLPSGCRAEELVKLNPTTAQEVEAGLTLLNELPSYRKHSEIHDLVKLLQDQGIECSDRDAMYALRKLSGSAKQIGENLAYVISMVRVPDEANEGKFKNNLTLAEAVKILSINPDINRIRQIAENVGVLAAGDNPPSNLEKLSLALVIMVSKYFESTRGVLVGADALRFVKELNGEDGQEKTGFTFESIRKALGNIKEPADIIVSSNKNKKNIDKNAPLRIPLNTPPFNPATDRYRNLVQMLRENGMEKEADEIDVRIEPAPEETNLATRNYQDALKALVDRRMELSRKLLEKMSASATDTTKGYGQFMCKAMNRYFRSLSAVDARTMLSAACRYSNGDNPMALLGATLKGAGPIMQKTLQGLASIEGLPVEFSKALEDMRSNLSDIPQTVVRAQLHELIAQSNGTIESITINKPLGAASVGQAFLCEMKLKGEEKPRSVVIKILRPDALPRLEREKEIFIAASKEVPGMEVTFAGQLESILEELDLRHEAENVIKGVVYGKEHEDVKSMELIKGVPTLRNVMVVKCAPGMTADRLLKDVRKQIDDVVGQFRQAGEREKLKDGQYSLNVNNGDGSKNMESYAKAQQKLARLYSDTLVQQKRLIKLAEIWANEGIYNGGFYHGDLHAGNIMLDPIKRDENGKVIEGSGTGGLTVIDFGNATQLTKDQQKAVMRMMMAATLQNTDRFLDNFAELMTPDGRRRFEANRNKGQKLHDLVHELLHLGSERDAEKRIFAILQRLMLVGYEMPGPVYKFAQCTIRLQGTIAEYNTELENIRKEMFKLRVAVRDGSRNQLSPCDPLKKYRDAFPSNLGVEYDTCSDFTGLNYMLKDDQGSINSLASSMVRDITMDARSPSYVGEREKLLEGIKDVYNRYVANTDVSNDPDALAKQQQIKQMFDELMPKVSESVKKQVEYDKERSKKEKDPASQKAKKSSERKDSLVKVYNQLVSRERSLKTLLARFRDQDVKWAEEITWYYNEGQAILATVGMGELKRSAEGAPVDEQKSELHKKLERLNLEVGSLGIMVESNEEFKDALVEDVDAIYKGDPPRVNDLENELLKEQPDGKFEISEDEVAQLQNEASLILRGSYENTVETLAKVDKILLLAIKDDDRRRVAVFNAIRQSIIDEIESNKPKEVNLVDPNKGKEVNLAELNNDKEKFRDKVFNEQLKPFLTEVIGFYIKHYQQNLKETLQIPEDQSAVPVGSCGLDDFFDSIGSVINSHIDQDLLSLNFDGDALDKLKNVGYLLKGLPSIISTVNRFGVKLAATAVSSHGEQKPD